MSIDWRTVKLADIADLSMGETLLSKNLTGGGIPVFSANTDEGPWGYTGNNRRRLHRGDIVIGARGSIGNPRRPNFDAFTCTQTTIAVQPDHSVVDSEYLHHALRAADILGIASQQAVPMLTIGALSPLEITLPKLDEQRRIAEVLRSVDDAIAAAENALAASQAVHRLSLEALFGVCFTEAYPDGEKIATIRQVCERVTYGFTNPMPTTDDGPWMLTAANVRHGWIDYNSARHTSVAAYVNDISEKSRPPIGAVLVTKDGTLGRVARVDRADVCINQSVAVLIPDATAVDGAFLSYLLQCPTGQDRMLADSGGSSVKHIYISKLAELPFVLPSMDVQQERALLAEESERAVQDQTRAVEGLRALKAHISSNLLSGHVRVPA